MKCPRCDAEMQEIFTKQGVVIDRCGSCQGLWFDKGEIFRFSRNRWYLAREIKKGLIGAHPSPIQCPRCQSAMVEGGLLTTEFVIDQCTGCEGLWFDKGELEKTLALEPVLKGHPAHGALLPKAPDMPEEADPQAAPGQAAAGPAGGDKATPPDAGEAAPRLERPWVGPGAAAMALAPLPSLAFRSTVVLAGLYGLLYLLIFLVVAAGEGSPLMALGVTLAVVVVQFLISPYLTDLTLSWLMSLKWVQPSELPQHLQDFLANLCRKENLPMPSLGIIDDGNPNAFTYGHTPRNARLVITRGLVEILEPAELEAVVGHEVGHMVHWDMLVMTAANLVPMLFYAVYDFCWNVARSGSGNSDDSKAKAGFASAAVAAYVCYIIGEYVVLFLSRTREYYADRYAAEVTRNPSALASALVKVAYGLVLRKAQQANEYKEAVAAGRTAAKPATAIGGLASMGIFDQGAARAMVASTSYSSAADTKTLVGAMQWDLWNPWAWYYEIHSTHPLPANRIDQLGRLSFRLGQKPFVVFDRRQPESFWDEFLVDCLFLFLPFILPLIALCVGAATGMAEARLMGLCLMALGAGAFARTWFAYSGGPFVEQTVSSLLSHVKVSGVRPVPAIVEGEVVGKGVPGLVWDEDLVIRDKTGIITLDYRQPLAILEWIFGLTRARQLQGKRVRAYGWYRRAPVPFVELSEIEDLETGSRNRCYVAPVKMTVSLFLAVLGFFVMAAGL